MKGFFLPAAPVLAVFFVISASTRPLFAAEQYALIVTGASGGAEYATKYEAWLSRFEAALLGDLGYPRGHVIALTENAENGHRSTREGVQAAFADLRSRVRHDDVFLVLLIGHGTAFYSDPPKFNLAGPDLSAGEWAELVNAVPGRLVFVNTTAASFPFLEWLAGPNRIVLTATDSRAQQYDTVFPEFFVSAFDDAAADLDRNNKVSIWEGFSYASAGVTSWFRDRGWLATERALLDDSGDGIGSAAGPSSADGELARKTFLELDVPTSATGNAALVALYRQRAEIHARLERLEADRGSASPEQYEEQLESLLLELALVDRQIREHR